MKKYGYTKEVYTTFPEAIDNIIYALKEEGFGILNKIDIKSKIKEKLGKDFDDYIILGACNPKLAYKALDNEIEMGLLLPCNVIVYKNVGRVYISVINPTKIMGTVENKEIQEIARIAEKKLKNAIDNI